MSTRKLRFGLHDFLNAQPLLVPLLRVEQEAGIEIVRAVPSALAEMLNAGDLDLAMIPTIEYLKQAHRYRLVPGVSIASRGKVSTVLLVTKVPLQDITTLVLDQRSRTSVALLQLLFASRFPKSIKFTTTAPDLPSMLASHDAALIIGDQAFAHTEIEGLLKVYDLSEEWFELTGNTFVHAVVAVREEVGLHKELLHKIQSARQEGLRNVDSILENYSGCRGIGKEVLLDYLQNKIIYGLGGPELAGMMEFRDRCFDRGIISQNPPFRFAGD